MCRPDVAVEQSGRVELLVDCKDVVADSVSSDVLASMEVSHFYVGIHIVAVLSTVVETF